MNVARVNNNRIMRFRGLVVDKCNLSFIDGKNINPCDGQANLLRNDFWFCNDERANLIYSDILICNERNANLLRSDNRLFDESHANLIIRNNNWSWTGFRANLFRNDNMLFYKCHAKNIIRHESWLCISSRAILLRSDNILLDDCLANRTRNDSSFCNGYRAKTVNMRTPLMLVGKDWYKQRRLVPESTTKFPTKYIILNL